MSNRLAFAGAVFAAIAALLGPELASAEGNLVVYCAVQEEWCRNAFFGQFSPLRIA